MWQPKEKTQMHIGRPAIIHYKDGTQEEGILDCISKNIHGHYTVRIKNEGKCYISVSNNLIQEISIKYEPEIQDAINKGLPLPDDVKHIVNQFTSPYVKI